MCLLSQNALQRKKKKERKKMKKLFLKPKVMGQEKAIYQYLNICFCSRKY